jgi:hypothetical protein
MLAAQWERMYLEQPGLRDYLCHAHHDILRANDPISAGEYDLFVQVVTTLPAPREAVRSRVALGDYQAVVRDW